MSTDSKDANNHRQRLTEVRDGLLVLHKALIESERIGYEQTFGKMESQNKFLQLLISDPWFAWLHPLSELVVVIDELLDGEEPLTTKNVSPVIDQVRGLLKTSEEGHGFPRSYFEALQREPDVVLAHASVMQRLNRQ
jgi:hypothetical protein